MTLNTAATKFAASILRIVSDYSSGLPDPFTSQHSSPSAKISLRSARESNDSVEGGTFWGGGGQPVGVAACLRGAGRRSGPTVIVGAGELTRTFF